MCDKYFILDLDDTLFITYPIHEKLLSYRFLSTEDYWKSFHELLDTVTLDSKCYVLVSFFINVLKWKPIILTARSEEVRDITLTSLKDMSPIVYENYHELLMRREQDTRPANVIKEEHIKNLLNALGSKAIVCAIDDESDNIRMFENNGIPTISWG